MNLAHSNSNHDTLGLRSQALSLLISFGPRHEVHMQDLVRADARIQTGHQIRMQAEHDEFQATKSLTHEPKKKCTLVKHDEKDYFEESKMFYILEL
ncbi:hypothetical protein NDU88_001375 [Pleurodeles waltl]|uniref:Uncharacterized protein n=1 Tax=Pleurodeles waltl TaxID=8319 RepID=A0AAV7Q6W0_PLEWA|nr:hypothetical protein NDU88_001375 [Pleurodeles waltl]